MKSLILLAILSSSTLAHAARWPESMELYQGLQCVEKLGTHNGTRIRILEFRYTGHTAPDENGKPFRAFDLIFTPSYYEGKEMPVPQVIQKDLGISNLGDELPLLVEASSHNAHQSGQPFRAVTTRLEQSTTLSVAGGVMVYPEFVLKSGNYRNSGQGRQVQEFRFHISLCEEIK